MIVYPVFQEAYTIYPCLPRLPTIHVYQGYLLSMSTKATIYHDYQVYITIHELEVLETNKNRVSLQGSGISINDFLLPISSLKQPPSYISLIST